MKYEVNKHVGEETPQRLGVFQNFEKAREFVDRTIEENHDPAKFGVWQHRPIDVFGTEFHFMFRKGPYSILYSVVPCLYELPIPVFLEFPPVS